MYEIDEEFYDHLIEQEEQRQYELHRQRNAVKMLLSSPVEPKRAKRKETLRERRLRKEREREGLI